MGLTKWNSETTSKFLSLYKAQECLWRNDIQEYRNKRARNTAIKSIIAAMDLQGLTEDDVKKKIKYLRSTYMVEVNKVEKSKQSGDGSYKPCLSWFYEMDSFIKSVQSKRNTQSVMLSQPKSKDSDEDTQEEFDETPVTEIGSIQIEIETSIKEESQPQWNDDEQAGQSGGSNKTPSTETGREQIPTPGSKRTRINRLNSIVKDMTSISKDLNKEEEDNEFEVFGKYVGIQLKSLREEDAILAQEEIMSILTRYKLKKIRRRSINYVTYTSDPLNNSQD